MGPTQIVPPLLYRDALMLVIDKPAGMAVHPSPGGGPSLTASLDALRFGLPRRPEAAHRLDRETSGCLALGRHRQALARLGKLFSENKVEKVYWAVVEGGPDAQEGEIDLPLGPRSPDPKSWLMKVDPAGQPSLTRWRVLGRGEGETWLELRPVTGRTHQLRVHCAAQGWPILGDRIYGSGGGRLQLHARSLTVPLHPKKPAIRVEAPPPPHMLDRLAALGCEAASDSSADMRAGSAAS
ncbi:RluA family pseudouridine synthase [Enterovirga aerilata]|uniref:RNA pseudouridine synthase n=1 Tax=Enterovirga aerilata TaxID=2730920 RepID=A0A849IBJ2_9HYPH|nr:RNA pseudouridine synthase [Enterovirga sp. DB1703]NNM73789.1 RNA pseudouridine synthase [Enterovirga sp. DB1703]